MSEPFEIAGQVKWFDLGRGFGFVAPFNGLPDVMLHVKCLRESGYSAAPNGSSVLCQAIEAEKGLHAVRVLSVDTSTAVEPARVTHRAVAESDWQRVEVIWYSRRRGFGFVTLNDGSPDIFVHAETLRQCSYTELKPGQTAMVRWGNGSKGRVAAEIKPAR